MFWGDNQVGQLGNRKRSFIESPYPSRKFEYRHNVENVVLGIDSSGVIVEDSGKEKIKNKKKKKRILNLDEVVQSDEELQMKTKAMVQKQTEGGEKDAEAHDGRGRRSLGERIREKFHNTFYKSGSGDGEGSTKGSGKQTALERLIEIEKEQNQKEKEKE